MNIEVRGGPKPLWVNEFACYDPDGQMAFSYQEYPERHHPIWLTAPEGSQVRESSDIQNPERPLTATRSMCATADYILAHYQDCADRGGLVWTSNPVADHALKMTQLSRVEPGFYGENAEYYFSLEIFQHGKTSFWTIKHGQKLPPSFRSKREPEYLVFAGEANGRVNLRNPDSGLEYWSHIEHLVDSEPPFVIGTKREHPKEEPILWSLLPAWMQFDLEAGVLGTAVPIPMLSRWAAGISAMKFEGSAHDKFESYLSCLDESGFDATASENPNRSYLVTSSTGGRHLKARIKTETDESALVTVVSTLAQPLIYLNYSAPGLLLPTSQL
jgi:hypothetical protein